MSLPSLHFVLPDKSERPTGGNLYNHALLAAVRAAGQPIRELRFADALRLPHESGPALLLVDSLLYVRAAELRMALPQALLFWIVHYFPGLSSVLDDPERDLWRQVERAAFDAAAGFIVTSEFARGELRARGVGHKPIVLVPPALTLEAGSVRVPSDRLRALMVGNLTAGKGVRDFLTTLAAEMPRDVHFHIEIAGREDLDPEYARACRLAVRDLPAFRGRVRFLGEVAGDALRRCYARSNLFISASGMESFGMALDEARAFGLPIFALAGGNARAHVEPGANGELFDSLEGLAEACVNLAREPKRLGSYLREAVRLRPRDRYIWADAARLFLEQLEALLAGEKVRAPREDSQ
jgi:glycosyltransferase involved in cell wall biosynthesis